MLGLLFLAGCSWIPHPQPQFTTLNGAQGGTIVYGVVAGATKPAAGLASVLLNVQNSCGEKPQVGNVFRVKGSHSDAVYFTVVDHPQNNRQAAGMVIAVQTAPKTVEAAMVTDDAARFSSTVNPLLTQLFSVWHPGAAQAAASGAAGAANAPGGQPANPNAQAGAGYAPGGYPNAPTGAGYAPGGNPNAPIGAGYAPGGNPMGPGGAPGSMPMAAGGGGGALPPMQKVTLQDNTASFSLPAGWSVDPQSGGGGAILHGPQGEKIGINMAFLASDPRSQTYQYQLRLNGGRPLPHTVVYPSNADLAKSFADIFQGLRASNQLPPAPLKVDKVEPISGSQGQCVDASGQFNPDGQGMQELEIMLCRTQPDQYGSYKFNVSQYQAPLGSTDQQRAVGNAIIASFQWNEQLVTQRATAQAAPEIAHLKQVDAAQRQAVQATTARAVGNIQQIGANATARMNATQSANQQQWAGFDQQESNISRQGQGFSNYLLDQSVVQNNNVGGTGAVGHATMWNSQANALVQANPNKYELVPQTNYWQGTDFKP
jgi:hypothetical protein